MAAADQDQGYVPLYKKGQPQAPVQQTPAPAAAAPVKDPNDQGYAPLVAPKPEGAASPPPASAQGQPSGWGIDWSKGGQVTMPQSVQDFGDIAGNEATMGTFASLKAQADAARQRLGPAASAGADMTGNVLS